MDTKNLKGKTVKIVANTCSHGFKIGEEVKIIHNNTGGGYPDMWSAKGKRGQTYNVYTSDIAPLKVTIDDMVKDIERYKKEHVEIDNKIAELSEQIQFLKDNELTDFVENEYKCYKVLKTINENTTDIEKARIIAKIIDQVN